MLAGAGGSSGASPATITLYSGQHVQTTQALVAAFEKQAGIPVNVRSEDEAALADQIVTEGSHSPADVVYTENTPPLEVLAGKGLLSGVARSTLARTPSRYDSSSGQWVGVSARVSVLIYNPSLISRTHLPATVLAMANPRYQGKLAIAPSETDFQPIVTSVARTYGSKAALRWLGGLKRNAGGRIYPDNETVASQVNRGVVAFGLINQYYWWRMGAELGRGALHSRLASLRAGDPGYVIDVSPAAILRSSRHQAEDQRFLAFLTSPAGQEIISHSLSYEYPIASGVVTSQPEVPFASLRPNPITPAELGDGSVAVSLMQQAGLL